MNVEEDTGVPPSIDGSYELPIPYSLKEFQYPAERGGELSTNRVAAKRRIALSTNTPMKRRLPRSVLQKGEAGPLGRCKRGVGGACDEARI